MNWASRHRILRKRHPNSSCSLSLLYWWAEEGQLKASIEQPEEGYLVLQSNFCKINTKKNMATSVIIIIHTWTHLLTVWLLLKVQLGSRLITGRLIQYIIQTMIIEVVRQTFTQINCHSRLWGEVRVRLLLDFLSSSTRHLCKRIKRWVLLSWLRKKRKKVRSKSLNLVCLI